MYFVAVPRYARCMVFVILCWLLWRCLSSENLSGMSSFCLTAGITHQSQEEEGRNAVRLTEDEEGTERSEINWLSFSNFVLISISKFIESINWRILQWIKPFFRGLSIASTLTKHLEIWFKSTIELNEKNWLNVFLKPAGL